jgi:hypothetical protein
MTNDEALEMLLNHPDPKMQEAGKLWSEHLEWCVKHFICLHQTLQTICESMAQLNLDIKYMAFDLEATRRERDALKGPE